MGTIVNVITVLCGSTIGLLIGNRLPDRIRATVTDMLGLFTIVMGVLSLPAISSADLVAAVGKGASVIVLLALLIGGIFGSAIKLEDRIEAAGENLKKKFGQSNSHTFVEGFVTTTLLFCVGPMTILGSLYDGLGRGADQLYVKSILDGFSSMAFASSLGFGVLLSAGSVLVIQGALTLIGFLLGDIMPLYQIDALTATGGIILIGLGIRLLDLKQVKVGDLVPALFVAPLLCWAVTVFS